MVQGIDWSQRELNVAFRIYVVEDFERDIRQVLNIDVLIHDNDAFGEHGLSE